MHKHSEVDTKVSRKACLDCSSGRATHGGRKVKLRARHCEDVQKEQKLARVHLLKPDTACSSFLAQRAVVSWQPCRAACQWSMRRVGPGCSHLCPGCSHVGLGCNHVAPGFSQVVPGCNHVGLCRHVLASGLTGVVCSTWCAHACCQMYTGSMSLVLLHATPKLRKDPRQAVCPAERSSASACPAGSQSPKDSESHLSSCSTGWNFDDSLEVSSVSDSGHQSREHLHLAGC